jgi:hypothetical protein
LQALRHYHRIWDAEKKIYQDHPEHDWSSHCADAWRTVGLTWKPSKLSTPDPGNQPISTAGWTWKQAVEHHMRKRKAAREGLL